MDNECCEKCEWIDYERDVYDRGIGFTSECRKPSCPCHTVAPTNLEKLQGDARREFEKKFITDDGDYCYVANDIEGSTVKDFQDYLIEKAFTAGKEEEANRIWNETFEMCPPDGHVEINDLLDIVKNRAARTNKTLD